MIAAVAAACALHIYAAAGRPVPSAHLHGPGLFLDGGGEDVKAGWTWMHDTLAGSGVRGGNVVILRASGDNDYDSWAMRVAPFASVRTILIPPCATPEQTGEAVPYVKAADAVFFAGGDQAGYVRWKGSALSAVVRGVYDRGGVVGGTSAGLAIQGARVYDSVAADRVLADGTLQTPQAVRDPFSPAISFTSDLFGWPALRETITDTHFARRDRFGRLAVFLARTGAEWGLGIDEGSALLVNSHGVATLAIGADRGYASRGAYVLHAAARPVLQRGKPIVYRVDVVHLHTPGQQFDLLAHRGAGETYSVTVDGARNPPYVPSNPYGTASDIGDCGVKVFRPAGTYVASRVLGPGLVLSGGGFTQAPYPQILQWIDAHIPRSGNARSGNLLVLSATGERYYSDFFYRDSRLASIQEITIPPCASTDDVNGVAEYVRRSQAVLFAGGDQANYVKWKGTELIAAIRNLYRSGGIVGGGSAGLAIQGAVVFDSVAADMRLPDDGDVATSDAVRDPLEPTISFTTGFFDWPPLNDSITDTHFARRDRFGRLAAFMARERVKFGVAVDEAAALLVDRNGIATLVQRAKEDDGYVPQGAFILSGGIARRLVPGKPLLFTVYVQHLTKPGQTYDLLTHHGMGRAYTVTVDGARTPPYSPRDPY